MVGVRVLLVWLLIQLIEASALAGPPFNTDFAQPIGYQHAEIDLYATSTRVQGDTSATLPGLQVDYGLFPNTQVRLVLPIAFDKSDGRAARYGIGDIEFGVKYRFIKGGNGWPQVSFFPLVLIPSGNRRAGLGHGHATYSLPLWLEENLGAWTIYGGGGYSVDPGAGNQGAWFGGIAALREITRNFHVGIEVFHKAPGTVGGSSGTTLDLGGSFDFTSSYHIYFSIARGIENPAANNDATGYVAFAWTF